MEAQPEKLNQKNSSYVRFVENLLAYKMRGIKKKVLKKSDRVRWGSANFNPYFFSFFKD